MIKGKVRILSIKIVITVILLYAVDKIFTNYYNSLSKSYTVGTLGSSYKPYGQGTKIRFSFEFYGEKVKSDNPKGYNEAKSKNYLIEVPIKDIKKSRILWDYPVPDTLKAPFEGWTEIPAFLEKKESD